MPPNPRIPGSDFPRLLLQSLTQASLAGDRRAQLELQREISNRRLGLVKQDLDARRKLIESQVAQQDFQLDQAELVANAQEILGMAPGTPGVDRTGAARQLAARGQLTGQGAIALGPEAERTPFGGAMQRLSLIQGGSLPTAGQEGQLALGQRQLAQRATEAGNQFALGSRAANLADRQFELTQSATLSQMQTTMAREFPELLSSGVTVGARTPGEFITALSNAPPGAFVSREKGETIDRMFDQLITLYSIDEATARTRIMAGAQLAGMQARVSPEILKIQTDFITNQSQRSIEAFQQANTAFENGNPEAARALIDLGVFFGNTAIVQSGEHGVGAIGATFTLEPGVTEQPRRIFPGTTERPRAFVDPTATFGAADIQQSPITERALAVGGGTIPGAIEFLEARPDLSPGELDLLSQNFGIPAAGGPLGLSPAATSARNEALQLLYDQSRESAIKALKDAQERQAATQAAADARLPLAPTEEDLSAMTPAELIFGAPFRAVGAGLEHHTGPPTLSPTPLGRPRP